MFQCFGFLVGVVAVGKLVRVIINSQTIHLNNWGVVKFLSLTKIRHFLKVLSEHLCCQRGSQLIIR